jgi:hypothetical protein
MPPIINALHFQVNRSSGLIIKSLYILLKFMKKEIFISLSFNLNISFPFYYILKCVPKLLVIS